MESSNLLAWKEVSPGRYERDTDEAEQFYSSFERLSEGTGYSAFAITACVRISIPASSESSVRFERALRSAWKRIRYEHPNIAAPTEYNPVSKRCKKVYQTLPDDEAFERWMENSFKVIDEGDSGEDFLNQDPPLGRFATLYLVIPPSPLEESSNSMLRRDIAFRSHHDIIDGVGTLMLLNNLLEHTSAAFSSKSGEIETVFGDEQKNLSPPFRIAAGIAEYTTSPQAAKFATAQASNTAARTGADVLNLPFKPHVARPLESQRVSVRLTGSETQLIIQKCKVYGITPTFAFHTAIALALCDIQPRTSQSRKTRYVSHALINLRNACKDPYNGAKHPASVYHCIPASWLAVDLTIPPLSTPLPSIQERRDEFVRVLNDVTTFYHAAKVNDDYLAIVPEIYSSVAPPYSETPNEVPAPSPASVTLSSCGIVDRVIKGQYGSIIVDDEREPWVVGSEYGTGFGLFLMTWKGRIFLSAAYNGAFHDKDEALMFLERVRRWVLDGLVVT